MAYSAVFRLAYLSIYYLLISLINLCNLFIMVLYMRHYYWAIIGYYAPFAKDSVFSFLYEKNLCYVFLYWGVGLSLLISSTTVSLLYIKKKKFLSLFLSFVPYSVVLLFHYDYIWWKWINDNIYDFGFYLI